MKKILLNQPARNLYLKSKLLKLISIFIEDEINPALEYHEASLSLVNISLNRNTIYLKLSEVCSNCKSASNTKEYIKEYMNEYLEEYLEPMNIKFL